jgi:hypothetical protein
MNGTRTCVIISGTPTAGFTVIGPFKHPATATEWASAWEEDIDWWVAPLVPQSDREVPNPKE